MGKGEKVNNASRAHHLARDARLTAESDYDILWVRPEEEMKALYKENWRPRVSATEMNRLRRLEGAKEELKGAEAVKGN